MILLLFGIAIDHNEIEAEANLEVKMYHNPVFEPAAPDPSFHYDKDGYFYLYSTEHVWNGNIDRLLIILRSADMIHWEYIGDVFTHRPEWHEGTLWAPQCVYNEKDETYYLYYAYVGNKVTAGVAVAVSQNPGGPFEDIGIVVDSFTIPACIDPFYLRTGSGSSKKTYIYAGSGKGIFGFEIADDMRTLIPPRFPVAGNAYEGSYVFEKDGFFYYIGSNGHCCSGVKSSYRLSVARSIDPRGPYLRRDGTDIILNRTEGDPFVRGERGNSWVGTGHNGEIIKDDLGRYFIIYHGVYPYNPLFPDHQRSFTTRRPLFMSEIEWGEDGWPVIKEQLTVSGYARAPYFDH
jgi:arabinan endo-1,5-alpha-L-arabinosidase